MYSDLRKAAHFFIRVDVISGLVKHNQNVKSFPDKNTKMEARDVYI